MNDKFLGKEGIIYKYNSRIELINYLRNAGVISGSVYALFGVGSEDIKKLCVGAGICGVSFLSGKYFSKLNEKRKDKYIKNLEDKSLST